jgi:hypothetical protein
MKSSKPNTAEAKFKQAFERLKAGTSTLLAPGTPVSQNNVAKEAGCDPSALRKTRFPSLVAEIQNHLEAHGGDRQMSERQKLLEKRRQSRSAHQMIVDLKKQRDSAASLLLEAYTQIGILTCRQRDLEARLKDLEPRASVLQLQTTKPKSTPRSVDIAPKS